MSTKRIVATLIGLYCSAFALTGFPGDPGPGPGPGVPMGDSAPLLGLAAIVLVAGIQYLRNKRR